ncbi:MULTISPECIES: hypothetical protein [unclassified Acinetobacter]|uniref:hypothetical protein n=1 Tax=unclassified Acinetobacter TaxID=196816 RepID=UPI0015D13C57|nr:MULTISPECIES: hypothetical protein [unclassified Acinetobacter]
MGKLFLMNSFFSSLSQGLYRLIILFLIFSYSLNDIELFAVYSSLITMLIVFQSIGSMGILSSSIAILTKNKNSGNFYNLLKSFLLISIILSIIFSVISYVYIEKMALINNPFYFSFLVATLIHIVFFKGYLNFKEKYLQLSLISFLVSIFILILIFLSNFNLFEIYSYSIIFESLFFLIFFLFNADIPEILKSEILIEDIKEILKFMIPISFAGFMIVPANALIINLFNYFKEIEELSKFNLGLQLRNVLTFIPSVIAVIFLRQIFKIQEKNNLNIMLSFFSIVIIDIVVFSLKYNNFSYLKLIDYTEIIYISLSSLLYVLFVDKINEYMRNSNTRNVVFIHLLWFLGFIIPFLTLFITKEYFFDLYISPFIIICIAYLCAIIFSRYLR